MPAIRGNGFDTAVMVLVNEGAATATTEGIFMIFGLVRDIKNHENLGPVVTIP